MPRLLRQNGRPDAPTAVVAGSFDGIHRGHRFLIDRTVESATQRGLQSLLITFDPHPLEVLRPQAAPRLLTTCHEKLHLLRQTSLDYLYFKKFDRDFASLTARQYLEWLRDTFAMRLLVVGYDHRFGSDRLSDHETLRRLGEKLGFDVLFVPPFRLDGRTVSSSLIRELVAGGRMRQANRFLGYPYLLFGRVVRGSRFGRKIGFPTANIRPESARKLLPPSGVYYVQVLLDGRWQKAVMNIGVRPTVEGTYRQIEVHIPDFEGDLYGRMLKTRILDFLRPERKFDSIEALRAQIALDVETVRRHEA